jgi:fatty-acyl-CoA synthase
MLTDVDAPPVFDTFAEVVRRRATDVAPGLLFDDQVWTWAEVIQEGADRAAYLRSFERPPGRQLHVGVLLDNVPDFVFWAVGTGLAGAVLVGINSSRSTTELAVDIRHADVDLIVTERRWHHLVADGGHGVPADRVLDVDSVEYQRQLAPHRGAELPTDLPAADDTYALMFSSGSTGAPKAVILSQGRLARLTPVLAERVELRRDSTTYLCMPLFHGNSLMMNLVAAVYVGARVGMVRKFSASQFSADIHRFSATYVNYVGRALSYVLSNPTDPRDQDSTLELAFGTEASDADVQHFAARFGCRVLEGYGLSEGVFRINRTPDTPPGSLGLPAAGADVRVLSEDTGTECPRAQFDASGRLLNAVAVGQIVGVGLAHTFEGYYKNDAARADRVRGADFWSGDLAYRDEAGYFFFAGRSSDWVRVDSENFAAAQVERVILRHPDVAGAPVYAVPDPVTGDRVMVALELDPGAGFDPVAFVTFLDDQPDMGAKWWPSYVRIVREMPLTGSGKVNKTPLRNAAWCTGDAVYVRVGKTSEYVLMDDVAKDELARAFTEHGRTAHLPVADAH